MVVVKTNEELSHKINEYYILSSLSFTSYYLGIFFNLDDPDPNIEEPPDDINYDIRMQKFWFTSQVYPYLQIPGPKNYTGKNSVL